MRRTLAFATSLAIASVAAPSRAEPQWNASLVTGVCGAGTRDAYWQDTCWWNGVRGDVMLGRERNRDFGIGPYLDLNTAGFEDARFGGGVTAHVPWHPYFPLVLSAGGYARRDDDAWEPGVAGWAFFGSRSYNFHSSYVMAGGLMLGLSYGLGDSRETAIVIGAQIDGLILALPFLLAVDALRGRPDDDD
jgi:hypothetical protein